MLDVLLGGWTLDRWEVLGFLGEALFFARLVVQWTSSEEARRPVLPITYWYMSVVGGILLIIYAWGIGRPAVLLPNLVGLFLYARNLQLELRLRRRWRWRKVMGFDDPTYPWPKISVIVPAHNEVKTLGETLRILLGQRYPQDRMEIIVAANGCTDGTVAVARTFPVRVVESERAGMSFGKNLGASAATGDLLVFIDADTHLEPDGLRTVVESLHGIARPIATVAGRPSHGGPVVRFAFLLANLRTSRRKLHAPGGVMALPRSFFQELGGFDETLPQGTSSDLILRACAKGGTYVFIDATVATTSIRRFEKTGIIRQMLDWNQTHHLLRKGDHLSIQAKRYEPIR